MPAVTRYLLTLCLLGAATAVAAEEEAVPSNDVTEADRLWVTFTRESAVVGSGKLRLAARGMLINKSTGDSAPDLTGFPFDDLEQTLAIQGNPDTVESIEGGRFDLFGSYGLGSTAEIGFDMPAFTQSLDFAGSTPTINNEDIGDLMLYGKFRRMWREHTAIGGGLELFVPTGSEKKRLGTGELAFNPYVNIRHTRGRVAVGGHVGLRMSQGEVPDVLNYSTFVIARGNRVFALRVELNGRYYKDFSEDFNDISVWPGIDFNISDRITVRPQGLAHLTDDAWEWGLGVALAVDLL